MMEQTKMLANRPHIVVSSLLFSFYLFPADNLYEGINFCITDNV
jgi:hypothetical protein